MSNDLKEYVGEGRPFIKGEGKLIEKLKRKIPKKIEEPLEDENGIFGFICHDGIYVAKKYIWNNIVSCHLRAVVSAMNLNRPLIMYINDVNKFYKFSPKKILSEGSENMRGSIRMINWNIKLGERCEI